MMLSRFLIFASIAFFITVWFIPAQAQSPGGKTTFSSKAEISEWSKKELGHDLYDTVSFNIEGRDIFVMMWDYASGISRDMIFVFSKSTYKNSKESWKLFCTRDTNTGKVSVEKDEAHKQLVFRSKAGKILMILPFEGLEMNFVKGEQ